MVRFLTFTIALLSTCIASCDKTNNSGDRIASHAMQLHVDGEYEEAVKAFEKALRLGLRQQKPDIVYTCLGNSYNELEEWDKSIAAHKKALEINPRNHQAWVNLGVVYRLIGEFDEAERCYSAALELEPNYAELHASIGALHVHQGKYEKAVQHLEKAIKLDPRIPVAWGNLALAYATVGDFDKADSTLKRAITLGYKNGPIVKERIEDLRATQSDSANKAGADDNGS